MNKKWINSTLKCEAYLSFEGESSEHKIVSARIRSSLRGNKKQTGKLTLLVNSDICNQETGLILSGDI